MGLDTLAQALTACQDRKREGDLLFGGGDFEAAEQVYRDAAAPLLAYTGADGADGADAARKAAVMRMILLQNRAACCHKLHRFAEAVELCTEALEYEPQAEQVLLQRARCSMAVGDYMAAYGDYWDLMTLKPDSLEPRKKMKDILALCPEVEEACARHAPGLVLCQDGHLQPAQPSRLLGFKAHRANRLLADRAGRQHPLSIWQLLAVSGAGVLMIGWMLALVAGVLSATASRTRSPSVTWGIHVWEDWGLLFRTLSLVADGGLVVTQGGLFGSSGSGGGAEWLDLLIGSTAVRGILSALKVPVQVDVLMQTRFGRVLGRFEILSTLPVFLAEYAVVWLCLRAMMLSAQHQSVDQEFPALSAYTFLLQGALVLYPLQAVIHFQLESRSLPSTEGAYSRDSRIPSLSKSS